MSDDVLVKVDNVSKRFCRSLKRSLWYGLQDLGSEIGGRRHGGGSGLPQSSADVQLRLDEFWAVKDVSFLLRKGECLGLLGPNGSGKSTLLRIITGLIKPDSGFVETKGRLLALIALGAGFNPILTGRENIYTTASVLGFSKAVVDSKISDIIEFSGIKDFIDAPVQSYSSGMTVRLGFAAATAFDPDVLILDEVLAVGDGAFKGKCLERISKMRSKCAVIFVSHNLLQVSRISTHILDLSNLSQTLSASVQHSIDAYQQSLFREEISGAPCYEFKRDIYIESINGRLLENSRLRFSCSSDISILIAAKQNKIKDCIYILKLVKFGSESECDIAQEGLVHFSDRKASLDLTLDLSLLSSGEYSCSMVLLYPSDPSRLLMKVENLFTISSTKKSLYKCPVVLISDQT
jgi:ABC-type polysaccharide/polyol phosphate transport system ATPase subunit